MKILLDTHTFLWFILDDTQLAKTAKQLIEDSENKLFVSTASLWEIAIKSSLGKLSIPLPFDQFISKQLLINEMNALSIKTSHLQEVSVLPFHHRDPFDRLIIAQCLVEAIPVISRDAAFDDYAIERLW